MKNTQLAIKIFLNSFYGALGSRFFRFYDVRVAEAITHSGQAAIQWIQRAINKYLQSINRTSLDYVVAIDTDSNYITLKGLVSTIEDAEKLSNRLEKVIADALKEFAKMTNSFESRLEMKREIIADRGLWTAKKRYILQVIDDDGFRLTIPKIKVTGIEAVRSSTPEICRKWLKEMFKLILNNSEEEIRKAHQEYLEKFKSLQPHEFAQTMTANNVKEFFDKEKIYSKGTPIHVRAALLYNHYLDVYKASSKYQKIKDSEKVKFIRLKTPNPFGEDVIGFINVLPKEFGLQDYIDYDTQFVKVFSDPIESILEKISYSLYEKSHVDNFFS